MKKKINIISIISMFICACFMLSGCFFSVTEKRMGMRLGNLKSCVNGITLKIETCENCTFSNPETPEDYYHVIAKFSISNNTNTNLLLNIGENFTAKYNNQDILEAENVSTKYELESISTIAANSVEEFEVGYLLPKDWIQFEVKYSPNEQTDIELIVADDVMDIEIKSQSMMPLFGAGDVVRIIINNEHQTLFEEGDVVAFYSPDNKIWVHRIVDFEFRDDHFYYTTKGDMNSNNDPFQVIDEDIIGYYIEN